MSEEKTSVGSSVSQRPGQARQRSSTARPASRSCRIAVPDAEQTELDRAAKAKQRPGLVCGRLEAPALRFAVRMWERWRGVAVWVPSVGRLFYRGR